jgi:tetratricopeptide (TPR) repeat protein
MSWKAAGSKEFAASDATATQEIVKMLRGARAVLAALRRRPVAALAGAVGVFLAVAAAVNLWALYHFRGAEQALREDRLDDAQRHVHLCLRVWNRTVATHLLAARIERALDHYAAIEDHLHEATRLQGGPSAATQLEWLLTRAQYGEVETVGPGLEGCVQQGHPESARMLEALARGLMRQIRLREAHVCLDRWIDLEPGAARAWYLRGSVRERLDRYGEAWGDYQRAAELAPWQWEAHLRVGEMALMLGNPAEAEKHLEPLTQSHAEEPRVMVAWASCLLLRGKLDEARTVLDALLHAHPENVAALVERGRVECAAGRPGQGEAYLRRALALRPYETSVLNPLVLCLKELPGHQTEAAELLARRQRIVADRDKLQSILQAPPGSLLDKPDRVAEVGRLLLRLGEDEAALRWLEAALRMDPHHRPAHEDLARYFEAHQDREKAAMHRRLAAAP